MSKLLRFLLDEDIETDLQRVFPKKARVYTVSGLGMSGCTDLAVTEVALARKCIIVTANKDFVPVYENHHWRKGKDGRFFWGLIFLKPSRHLTRAEQVKRAIPEIRSDYDDIITVSATGAITRKQLDTY